MRIAVVSHSMVAERQWMFWDYFARAGHEVLKVSPKGWAGHRVDWGYEVDGASMIEFTFPQKALSDVEAFKPDLIYVQDEAYCKVTSQFKRLAKRIGCKFAIFVWENIKEPNAEARRNLYDADLVVCGSSRAQENASHSCSRDPIHCIQVGVNTSLFNVYGFTFSPSYDVIFIGRPVWEKGIDVIKEAVIGTSLSVLWPEGRVPYIDLPEHLSKARIHASPSIDTPAWQEQHASYANLEALSCGLYVATSDSDCIYEALFGCPGVMFSRQNNVEDLRENLLMFRALYDAKGPNLAGRQWVEERYGYDAMRSRLVTEFEGIL